MRNLLMYPWLPGMKTVYEKVIYSKSLYEVQSFMDIKSYEQQFRTDRNINMLKLILNSSYIWNF